MATSHSSRGAGRSADDGPADLLVRGGRVVDPETGRDDLRDVVIKSGTIVGVVEPGRAPAAQLVLDAVGMVVAPGFIDLHSHLTTPTELLLQACDGVTTALDLEAGAAPVAREYARCAVEGMPVHYGFSASWALHRMAAAGLPIDRGRAAFFDHIADPGWRVHDTPGGRDALMERLVGELADGALGIGVLLGYAPASDRLEYQEIVAFGRTQRRAHIHPCSRHRRSRCRVRWCRGGGDGRAGHRRPHHAARPGHDRLFAEDDPDDQRLLERAMLFADAAIASDAMPLPQDAATSWPVAEEVATHPRTTRTFCRTLRWLSRILAAAPLIDVIARATLRPAQILADVAPAMSRKGRVQAGADADLAVFDPRIVTDRSDSTAPSRTSIGMRHVIVAGTPVVRDGIADPAHPSRTADPRQLTIAQPLPAGVKPSAVLGIAMSLRMLS